VLTEFGAKVTADTCIVVAPLVHAGARVLMTNSAKYAHYAPGLIGVQAAFGSTEECVESAVAGRVTVEDGPWAA
jgi:cis-L-3-hydroxyproline dehydratase